MEIGRKCRSVWTMLKIRVPPVPSACCRSTVSASNSNSNSQQSSGTLRPSRISGITDTEASPSPGMRRSTIKGKDQTSIRVIIGCVIAGFCGFGLYLVGGGNKLPKELRATCEAPHVRKVTLYAEKRHKSVGIYSFLDDPVSQAVVSHDKYRTASFEGAGVSLGLKLLHWLMHTMLGFKCRFQTFVSNLLLTGAQILCGILVQHQKHHQRKFCARLHGHCAGRRSLHRELFPSTKGCVLTDGWLKIQQRTISLTIWVVAFLYKISAVEKKLVSTVQASQAAGAERHYSI
jgi:hypothetical protein